MKLSYEDKVQIYELRKQGISFKRLSDKYGMNLSNLKYLVRLIDRYGIEIVKKGKSHYYSPELKQEMIELERLQEENERLRTEVAYLKKLKELEERDEALEQERQRQLEKWSQEDFD